MLHPAANVTDNGGFVLSSLPPSRFQERFAFAVMASLMVIFLLIVAGPLSNIQLGKVIAFVPAYVTAMFMNDLITAILLFSQFSIVRSRAVLVLASGYLFAALMLIAVFLTFPGVFERDALMGGLQSTSWLYFFWHGGFPLFVVGYALAKDAAPAQRYWQGTVSSALILSVTLTTAVVVAFAILCIGGNDLLPHVRQDAQHLDPLWPYFGVPIALISIVALAVLWARRRSILDLWLLVVLSAYAVEVPLTYFPAQTIFGVGWYAGRIFGFLSSGLVLLVLLHEITAVYAKLLGAVLAQRREREARLMTGNAVAATIAHEVRQPLTGMIASADAGLRFLNRSVPEVGQAMEAFRRIATDGQRAGAVIGSIRAIFKSEVSTTDQIDISMLIDETLALVRGELEEHRIQVLRELGRRLPHVRGDGIQLQQVLLNLFANAIEAMASTEGSRVLHVRSEEYETGNIMVSVADTGAGVDAQNMERIFGPLFSTKSEGMGMGLSICRSIIEAHRGHLRVAPNSPKGAVFHFTLHPGIASNG